MTGDYRLASEVGYQGSIEDNYAGLRWLFGNAATLGVDSRQVAVMGKAPAAAMPRCWHRTAS